MTTAEAPSVTNDGFSRGYRAWLLLVLIAINALNLIDRQSIAISGPVIKRDLVLTDFELGLVQGFAFAIFFTLLSLPIARLAERRSRARIISVAIVVLGAALAACGVAQNFWQMILCRIGVGSGDAGAGPPVASLIGDHYPAEKRGSANALIWLGAPVGVIVGTMIGGWYAQYIGWRQWYFLMGAVAFVIGLLSLVTLREPARGTYDRADGAAPPPMWDVVKFLWAKRSMRHVFLGAGIAAIPLNALGQFFGLFVVSNFHMGLAEAGLILGTMASVSMASGMLLGGFGVQAWAKKDLRWYVWAPAITLAFATPFMAFGVLQDTIVMTVAILLIGHVALFVFWTPTLTIAQNMVGASMRASSAFIAFIMLGLVGIGIGPPLIGYLSDVFAQWSFPVGSFAVTCPGGMAPNGSVASLTQACADASAAGVKYAIVAMSLLFLWAAVHYALAARNLRQDLDTHYSA